MHHLENVEQINGTFIDEADFINITMPMYNLIEYSNNYSDTSGSLWNFKRDEIGGNDDLTVNNSSSCKYKSSLIGNLANNGGKEGVKIAGTTKIFKQFLEIVRNTVT